MLGRSGMTGLRAEKGTAQLCKECRDSNPARRAQPVSRGDNAVSLDLLAQGSYVGPQFPPRLLFLLGQSGQGLVVADRGQAWVPAPVSQTFLEPLPGVAVLLARQGGVRAQVGPQPVEGLLAQAGP